VDIDNPGFRAEANVPANANPGTYDASLLAVSGVASNQQRIQVAIFKSLDDLLKDEIQKLRAELAVLESKSATAKGLGIEVTCSARRRS
jgi:hypothetical protein